MVAKQKGRLLVLSRLASLSSFLSVQALSSGVGAAHIQDESLLGLPLQIHSGRIDGGIRGWKGKEERMEREGGRSPAPPFT